MTKNTRHNVLVVGAGVIGCSIAQRLAPDHDVLVLDKAGVGSEASGLAAGLTAPTLFYYRNPAVAEHANEFFREFDGTDKFTYSERPRIEFVEPDQEAAAREQVEAMAGAGFPVVFLDVDTIEEEYPWFNASEFAGVIEIGDAGFIDDPYVFVNALKVDAEDHGAEFLSGVEVTDLLTDGGAISGVRTTNGEFHAPNVVFAAGWRTHKLVDDYAALPTRPFVLQCVTTNFDQEFGEHFPVGRVAAEEVYFRPQHNGRLRFGGGEYLTDDPEAKTNTIRNGRCDINDKTTQEAVAIDDTTDTFERRVAEVAPRILAAFDDPNDIEFEDGWSGVGVATPDTRPIVDSPDESPTGLHIATGFNGLGITTAPAAATLVRSLVTGEPMPFSSEMFALNRFDTPSIDFQLQDTFDMGRK